MTSTIPVTKYSIQSITKLLLYFQSLNLQFLLPDSLSDIKTLKSPRRNSAKRSSEKIVPITPKSTPLTPKSNRSNDSSKSTTPRSTSERLAMKKPTTPRMVVSECKFDDYLKSNNKNRKSVSLPDEKAIGRLRSLIQGHKFRANEAFSDFSFYKKSKSDEEIPIDFEEEGLPPIEGKKISKYFLIFFQVIIDKFSFEFCLLNEICREYFKKCLEQQFCVENYLFYYQLKQFKEEKDPRMRNEHAMKMIADFFILGAEHELNITNEQKSKCKKQCQDIFKDRQDIPLYFFDGILKICMITLKEDQYKRFIISKEFKEYFNKFGVQLIDFEEEEEVTELFC